MALFISDTGAPVWVGGEANDIAYSQVLRIDAKARALREHRRLLYVALTRAQDRLVVGRRCRRQFHDRLSRDGLVFRLRESHDPARSQGRSPKCRRSMAVRSAATAMRRSC